jgi:hypothetical protein
MNRVVDMSIKELWECYHATKQRFILRIIRSKYENARF